MTHRNPAELEQRLRARMLDSLLMVGAVALAVSLGSGETATTALVGILGFTVVSALLQSVTGATAGQRLVGLRVADAESEGRPSVPRSVQREALVLITGVATLGLGWASLGWSCCSDPTGRRRGWHDRLFETAVVRAESGSRVSAVELPVDQVRRPVNVTEDLTGVVRLGQEPQWWLRLPDGRVEPLRAVTLVGRDPLLTQGQEHARSVRLDDPLVSRTHLMITGDDEGLRATDQPVTNPTRLIREGRTREFSAGDWVELRPGDVLQVGDQRLGVELTGEPLVAGGAPLTATPAEVSGVV